MMPLCWCGEPWTPEHGAEASDALKRHTDRAMGLVPLAHVAVDPKQNPLQADMRDILMTISVTPPPTSGQPFSYDAIAAMLLGTLLQENYKIFAPPR